MFVASWNGEGIARGEGCILVENSLYFPPDSIRTGALVPGNGNSQCYWKGGEASYFDVHAAGKVNPGACARARCRGPSAARIHRRLGQLLAYRRCSTGIARGSGGSRP